MLLKAIVLGLTFECMSLEKRHQCGERSLATIPLTPALNHCTYVNELVSSNYAYVSLSSIELASITLLWWAQCAMHFYIY